jgi:hypothetical protein
MANTKHVKKALSTNKAAFARPSFFKNKLDIPSDILKELNSKQLEGRWIDYQRYVLNGNAHENGWEIYKREKKAEGAEALAFGNSPDGIIRRASLVLAARPKAQGDEHRQWLRSKAKAADMHNRAKADELRTMVSEDEATITEGFEDEQD